VQNFGTFDMCSFTSIPTLRQRLRATLSASEWVKLCTLVLAVVYDSPAVKTS